jgi:hypothetical protein
LWEAEWAYRHGQRTKAAIAGRQKIIALTIPDNLRALAVVAASEDIMSRDHCAGPAPGQTSIICR